MAERPNEPGRGRALLRLANYDRPWVGRVGLILGLMLWLLVTASGFAAGFANGLLILILGGALIFGEVWIARSAGRRPTLVSLWRLSLRFAMGVVLIVLAVLTADGWGATLLVVIGAWLIIPALLLGRFV